jgi:hypothetical protein
MEAFTSNKVSMMPKSSQSSTAAANTAATSIMKGIGPAIESSDQTQGGNCFKLKETLMRRSKDMTRASVTAEYKEIRCMGGEVIVLKKLRCDSETNSGRCTQSLVELSD